MPPNTRGQTLNSRDPSNRSYAVRLPPELSSAVDAACAESNITASELLRSLVEQWAYGRNGLSGPDAGYSQARGLASQIAHAALRRALEQLPTTHEEATSMLQGYYAEQAERRKR